MKKTQIKILGSGTSTGIPVLGCSCDVCHSLDSRDQRLRSSILIETPRGKRILVDTSPDLRAQLLSTKTTSIDAVILTHEHADHLHGIDDLRPLGFKRDGNIALYGHHRLKELLRVRFPYIFTPVDNPIGGGIPKIEYHSIFEFNQTIEIEGERFTFFELPHGRTLSMGFMLQSCDQTFAYLIDCHEIPIGVINHLKEVQLDFLIIDCVTKAPHLTHLSQDVAFDYISQIGPKRAGLIHMGHHLGHAQLLKTCQSEFTFEVAPLFDGEVITL